MKSPCEECAFSKKGAGQEPYNSLRGKICALGPIPFGCHHGTDWADSSSWSHDQVQLALRTTGICQGWAAEVRRLKARGWYGPYRLIRRAIARRALLFIELFTAAKQGTPEKKKYLAQLKRMMRFLGTKDIEHKKIPL